MFKCVFIPASSDPIQELSKSKSGGLENDLLRKSAEEHFNRTKLQTSSSESTEQVAAMLRQQGLDPSTMDKNLLAQLSSIGGGPCEIVTLHLPSKDNGFDSVSMYCDSSGQAKNLPVNARATSLANCCGHNTTVYGDAFIGRAFDDESQPWERKDFTTADMNSDAPWVISARKKNQGKNMNSYSTSGTMQNFLKQQASSSVGSEEVVKPTPAPEKEEDIIKREANSLFIAKNFAGAEELYTKAIAVAGAESLAVLYTNRSAARANLDRNAEALADAELAIQHDRTWMKAYHRKSAALEKLNRHREAYLTWVEASKHCQDDKGLVKQMHLARTQWVRVFRTAAAPLEGDEDLVSRFALLTDKRERLSTLAHLWNDSCREDRHKYFQVFLSLISGDGKVNPATNVFTVDFMVDMPMENYKDLPRSQVGPWCDYVQAQSSERRLALFQKMWYLLSSEEHNDVIQDFKMLMSEGLVERDEAEKAARKAKAAGSGAGSSTNGGSSAGGEDDGLN